MKLIHIVPFVVLATGCAFKEPVTGRGQEKPSSESATHHHQPADQVGEITVSYLAGSKIIEKKRALIKDGTAVRVEKPILLPAVVPESIKVSVSMASMFEESDLAVNVQAKPRGASNYSKVVAQCSASNNGLTLEISKLREQLSDSTESSVSLLVEAFQRTTTKAAVSLELVTPPSRLMGQIITIERAIQEHADLAQDIENIRQQGLQGTKLRLDLLSLVQVRNDSFLPVVAHIPVRLKGMVRHQIHTYSPRQTGCVWSVAESDTIETLSEDIFALPITGEIQNEFETRLATAKSQRVAPFQVTAGKSRLIGIFGLGSRITGRAKSKAGSMSVTNCYSKCEEGFHVYGWLNSQTDSCWRCERGEWRMCDECKRYADSHPNFAADICKRWGTAYTADTLTSGTLTMTFLELAEESKAVSASFEGEQLESPENRQNIVFDSRVQLN